MRPAMAPDHYDVLTDVTQSGPAVDPTQETKRQEEEHD
jgi:hypothetical protein